MKTIRIPVWLFEMMVSYIRDHYDGGDLYRYRKIESGIEEKREAVKRRAYYTLYKTAEGNEVRGYARQLYLDAVKMHPDFQWDDNNTKTEQ